MLLLILNYLLPPPERDPPELLPPERLPEEVPVERELLLLEEDLTDEERAGVLVLLYVLVGVLVGLLSWISLCF